MALLYIKCLMALLYIKPRKLSLAKVLHFSIFHKYYASSRTSNYSQ